MAPVEARYTLNGEERDKITAEDGAPIALNTPAGLARAKLDPRIHGNALDGSLGERFQTKFPGQNTFREKPYRDTPWDKLHFFIFFFRAKNRDTNTFFH